MGTVTLWDSTGLNSDGHNKSMTGWAGEDLSALPGEASIHEASGKHDTERHHASEGTVSVTLASGSEFANLAQIREHGNQV